MATSAGAERHKDLPPAVVAELLHPPCWNEVLGTFAGAVGLAVGLTDTEGHLLSDCWNPQPAWIVARRAPPESDAGCSFCLAPPVPCTAVRQALKSGRFLTVGDGCGMIHAAIPLSLEGRPIGALLAGQIFEDHPEAIRLQRVAGEFGKSPQRLWQVAGAQAPVGRTALRLYAGLLQTVGQTFLRQRYAAIVERKMKEPAKFGLVTAGSDSGGEHSCVRNYRCTATGVVEMISIDERPERSLGTMAGRAALDLNHLLRGILANASSILDDTAPSYRHMRLLEDVVRAGTVADGVTRELLACAGREPQVIYPLRSFRANRENASAAPAFAGRRRRPEPAHGQESDDPRRKISDPKAPVPAGMRAVASNLKR